jgi:hypothetical protein
MNTQQLKVRITFTEQLLASASGNPELHEEFIAARVANDRTKTLAQQQENSGEEVAVAQSVAEVVEKTSTIFHRDETGLFLWDYQWRGFFKERIGTLCELGEMKHISKWTYKRVVDQALFVSPRRIYLTSEGAAVKKPDGTLQRPLRASTMQGDRVALARSEYVDAGTQCEFTVKLLITSNAKSAWRDLDVDLVRSCLDMGQNSGHGQWRGGGYGRFTWEEVKV